MPHEIEIVVPAGKKRERLDVYLTHHVEHATRNKVQRAIEEGAVLVNGRRVRSSFQISGNEVILITLPQPPPQKALPENIPLDILFEDNEVLVVNKPAGMVTHPAHGNYSGTLVNALLYHCNALPTFGDRTRPGIVHRLDKDTAGVMVVAKTDHAHAFLGRQFAARTISREYWALVWGTFKENKGTVEANLGRSKADRKKMAVVTDGKHAVTEYTVIHRYEYLSLIKLKLQTGRTHQIRVHLAHINHPVFGDPTYNGRHIVAGPGSQKQKAEVHQLLKLLHRQALHAKTLGFVHPRTKKEMTFDSDLPKDFQSVLYSLK